MIGLSRIKISIFWIVVIELPIKPYSPYSRTAVQYLQSLEQLTGYDEQEFCENK